MADLKRNLSLLQKVLQAFPQAVVGRIANPSCRQSLVFRRVDQTQRIQVLVQGVGGAAGAFRAKFQNDPPMNLGRILLQETREEYKQDEQGERHRHENAERHHDQPSPVRSPSLTATGPKKGTVPLRKRDSPLFRSRTWLKDSSFEHLQG